MYSYISFTFCIVLGKSLPASDSHTERCFIRRLIGRFKLYVPWRSFGCQRKFEIIFTNR